jgi:hypothetical protein
MRLGNRDRSAFRLERDARVHCIRMRFEQGHGADFALIHFEGQLQRAGRHRNGFPQVQNARNVLYIRMHLRILQQFLRRDQYQLRSILCMRRRRVHQAKNRGENQSLHPEPLSRNLTSSRRGCRGTISRIHPVRTSRHNRQRRKRRAHFLRPRPRFHPHQR